MPVPTLRILVWILPVFVGSCITAIMIVISVGSSINVLARFDSSLGHSKWEYGFLSKCFEILMWEGGLISLLHYNRTTVILCKSWLVSASHNTEASAAGVTHGSNQ